MSKYYDMLIENNKKDLPKDMLEAGFNCLSNKMFHEFSKEIEDEVGLPGTDRVSPKWQEWLKEQIRGKKI